MVPHSVLNLFLNRTKSCQFRKEDDRSGHNRGWCKAPKKKRPGGIRKLFVRLKCLSNVPCDKGQSGPFLRAAKHANIALFLVFMGLSACSGLPQPAPTLVQTEQFSQYRTVPSNRAWVSMPTALIVTQRGLRDSMEQRIGLPNKTTVKGDNFALLRARAPEGSDQGRLAFHEFLRRIGTLPHPFTDLVSGDMRAGEDSIGAYLWAEKRTGSGTICVLAMRRMTYAMRQLPGDYSVLDVLVRNCVDGPLEEALLPITDGYAGSGYGVSNGIPDGKSRLLSPLAGPTPR
jgi:hypothetical protein